MLYQTTPGLLDPIHHFGCGILSSCYVLGALKYLDSVDAMNELYYDLLKNGAITQDCTITWAPFTEYLQVPFKFKAIVKADYVLQPGEVCIEQWFYDVTGVKHFCATQWDPWDVKGSQTRALGVLYGKRVWQKAS